jgi:hypothetical protein
LAGRHLAWSALRRLVKFKAARLADVMAAIDNGMSPGRRVI